MFAASALLLACIGLFGTLSHLGHLRPREVGVRLAFGALRGQIVADFLLQGLRLTAIGCFAVLVLSLSGDRLISNVLYAVKTLDPETYGAVVVLIVLVATMASLIPDVAVGAGRNDTGPSTAVNMLCASPIGG